MRYPCASYYIPQCRRWMVFRGPTLRHPATSLATWPRSDGTFNSSRTEAFRAILQTSPKVCLNISNQRLAVRGHQCCTTAARDSHHARRLPTTPPHVSSSLLTQPLAGSREISLGLSEPSSVGLKEKHLLSFAFCGRARSCCALPMSGDIYF